jgi:YD repeat-containing protein
MKRSSLALGIILASCQSNTSLDQVVCQKYVHKYGFDVSPQEWEERDRDGQVIEELKSGVKITSSYENGKLHGPTTYTFPHSDTVEKLLVYDQGILLKETRYDLNGVPLREDLYEFDHRVITTLWDAQGIPLSVEEYENDILVDGKYYTPEHELEGKVESGYGLRIKRGREGQLISKDKMQHGTMTERTAYHPNGEVHTVSHYHDYQLHGPQMKYTATGKPLIELTWNHGILHGIKSIYRNGMKVAEVPYVDGEKHGIEYHYDDLGNLISETTWQSDQKHGVAKSYTEEGLVEEEWFHHGMAVDAKKFILLENRDQVIAELSLE